MKDEEVDEALAELAEAGLVLYDDETSTVLIINAVKYLPKSKEMRKSVVNDLIFNNSPLADELLRAHPHIRQWDEWTEEVQYTFDSRKAKQGWDDKDDETPF